MDTPFHAEISLGTEDETARFGARLAPRLSPGDCLLLSGPIGAGKTHFARALIQARLADAGLTEDVPSPTFTLVQTYSDGVTEIWHADLYRLTGPEDVLELGLDDAFSSAITLVEWPDRLGETTPKDALHIHFQSEGEGRRAVLTSDAERWARIVPLSEGAA